MPRGQKASPGDTRWSPNGYHYTRLEKKWELTHRILAEKKLGRPLADDERVTFQDNDRTNLTVENIVVRKKNIVSNASRRARLEARIEELQAQVEALDEED